MNRVYNPEFKHWEQFSNKKHKLDYELYQRNQIFPRGSGDKEFFKLHFKMPVGKEDFIEFSQTWSGKEAERIWAFLVNRYAFNRGGRFVPVFWSNKHAKYQLDTRAKVVRDLDKG